jgi:putative DNA-invertase from lambdoid prophage Rac
VNYKSVNSASMPNASGGRLRRSARTSSGAKASRPALNRLIADAEARKIDCLLVWKLDRFGGSLVATSGSRRRTASGSSRSPKLDTDLQNPALQFLLHVLGAAAEFKLALIRERVQAGHARYKQDFESGKVGKTVHSRSGRNLPPHRPRRVFDRDEVLRLRRQGWSYRQIAKSLGLGLGTVVRALQLRSKSS